MAFISNPVANVVSGSREAFAHAVRIYTANDAVGSYNFEHLQSLAYEEGACQPVRLITATGTGQQHQNISPQDAGMLDMRLYLGKGARVMLTDNLWVERGLVNGATGTIDDIVWAPGANWRSEVPAIIYVLHLAAIKGQLFMRGSMMALLWFPYSKLPRSFRRTSCRTPELNSL